MNLACPWDGVIRSVPLSWEDDDVEDRACELVGAELIFVEEAAPGRVDFQFSNAVLRVRPDTDLDPWVLHLPDVIVVGTMA